MQQGVWGRVVLSVAVWASVVSSAEYQVIDLGSVVPTAIDVDGSVVGTAGPQDPEAVLVDRQGHLRRLGFLPTPGCVPPRVTPSM